MTDDLGHKYTQPSKKIGGPAPYCTRCGEVRPLFKNRERPCGSPRPPPLPQKPYDMEPDIYDCLTRLAYHPANLTHEERQQAAKVAADWIKEQRAKKAGGTPH